MKLQKASVEEFDKIRNFYWDLIDRTKDRSDTVGWKKGIKTVRLDILKGNIAAERLYKKPDSALFSQKPCFMKTPVGPSSLCMN